MKLTLETKVRVATSIGKKVEEYVMTLERLGFVQSDLDSNTMDEIENKIQERFVGWTVEYIEYE